MIYLIQPQNYSVHLANWLTNYLRCFMPHETLLVLSHCPKADLQQICSYFIIFDERRKDWPAIEIAQSIRLQNSTSPIVLMTNHFNHPLFYRSHLSLLSIIDLENPFDELTDCLLYLSSDMFPD